jgi:threonine dehydrogenase-like Zn-dependent dehydrogenase
LRALVFDLSLLRYGLAKALGKRLPSLYYGRPSCLSLREVPEPKLRGPDWIKLSVHSTGFCGSDLSTILFKYSPSLSPFSSMPCVLGHEIFGRLEEVGAGARARGWKEGDRVVVNPSFGCVVRGILPHCPSCAIGHPATCLHAGSSAGGLAPGFSLGFHKDLPGGFSEKLIAHHTQLQRVPDSVPDERAVMTEPLAIGVHAVLHREPRPDEKILIIGGGMIAYSVLAALRMLGFTNHVTQLLLLPFQAELARSLGADEVIQIGPGVDVMERVMALTGATRHKPILGPDVMLGGFPVVFDCIGSPESLRDSFNYVASHGTVVLAGNCGVIPKLDLTWIWAKEIALVGTYFYGPEPARGGKHTLDLTLELLSGDARADRLVTHSFDLAQYQEAVIANLERGRYKSVKTIFRSGA